MLTFRSLFVIAVLVVFSPSVFAQSFKHSRAFPSNAELYNGQMPAPAAPGFSPNSYFWGLPVPGISTDFIPQPVPVDPSDMLMQDAIYRSDFGNGYAIATQANNDPLAVFRLVPNVKLDTNYDTGNPGSDNLALTPSLFALEGTPEARREGQFSMRDSTANLKSDLQIPTLAAQGYVELNANSDSISFRQAYARVGNILGGAYWSSFGDPGSLPQTMVANGAPAGAIFQPNQIQLQYVKILRSGFWLGAAIENPTTSDFTLVHNDPNNPANSDFGLTRSPDFVARIRYQPVDSWASVQCAVLVRQIAYSDAFTGDHSTMGWGLSTNARFKTFRDDNVRFGFVTGQGIANRIFGLSGDMVGAGPNNGVLVPLTNMGAYLSYQHVWSNNFFSNIAYGYSSASLPSSMPDSSTRLAQNGWANMIWNNASGKFAVGFEYQVGQREAHNGTEGLNHHIQLSLQVGKGYVPTDSASNPPAGAAAAAAAPGANVPAGDMQSRQTKSYPRL